MKYRLHKSVLILAMTSVGALEFGRGIINTFSSDIFDSCITDPEAATTYLCRNALDLVQMFTIAIATLVFFLVVYGATHSGVVTKKLINKALLLKVAVLSLIYAALLIANWKLQEDLSDNFQNLAYTNQPQAFTEYLYALYFWMDTLLIGAILGFVVWLPGAASKHALDPAKRKEPRATFKKK